MCVYECIYVHICRHLYLLSLYNLQYKWLQDPVSLHTLLNTSHFFFPATFFVYRWESWRSDNLKESPKITQMAKRRCKSLLCSSPLFIHKGFVEPHAPVIREAKMGWQWVVRNYGCGMRCGNEEWRLYRRLKGTSPLWLPFPLVFLLNLKHGIWWRYLGQWWWAHLSYCWVLITNWQLLWAHTRPGTKPKAFMYYLTPSN